MRQRDEGPVNLWVRNHGWTARWYDFTRYGALHGVRREAQRLADSLENLIDWFPVIWRDRDWDHSHLLRLMEHKLRRMAHLHQYYGHLVRSKRTAKELRVAAELCRRLADEEYSYGYGVPDTEAFLRIGRPDYPRGQFCLNAPLTELQRKKIRWAAEHNQAMARQDRELLATMLRKYLPHWWD